MQISQCCHLTTFMAAKTTFLNEEFQRRPSAVSDGFYVTNMTWFVTTCPNHRCRVSWCAWCHAQTPHKEVTFTLANIKTQQWWRKFFKSVLTEKILALVKNKRPPPKQMKINAVWILHHPKLLICSLPEPEQWAKLKPGHIRRASLGLRWSKAHLSRSLYRCCDPHLRWFFFSVASGTTVFTVARMISCNIRP